MQINIKDNNPCGEVEIRLVTEILLERVTRIALYNAVTSKENPCLPPGSAIYSGYSAHAVMMQYGNTDIMLDVIRGIDAIRTEACALSRGLHESGRFRVLML